MEINFVTKQCKINIGQDEIYCSDISDPTTLANFLQRIETIYSLRINEFLDMISGIKKIIGESKNNSYLIIDETKINKELNKYLPNIHLTYK